MTGKGVLFSMPPKKQDFGGVLGLIVLVFTGVVRPIRIVPQHGGGNAESKENVVITPLGIGKRLCWPKVVGPQRLHRAHSCPFSISR
jgi:hypothetical protein